MRPGNYTMQGVDVVKSVAGLYKHMKNGVLNLTNTFVDIDGDCEVEKKTLVCHRIHMKGKQYKFIINQHTNNY